MIKFFFKIFVWFRDKFNPTKLPTNKEEWNKVRKLSFQEFSDWVNSFTYLSDPLSGFFDKTETFEHFIDPNIKSGRDCDDFAEMFKLWGIFNKRKAYTVVITIKAHPFKKSHIVTVLYDDSTKKYTLCNYTHAIEADTLEEAIDKIRQWKTYKDGYIYAIQCTKEALTEEEIKVWEN